MDMTEHGSMELKTEGEPRLDAESKEAEIPSIRPLIPIGPDRKKRTGKEKFVKHDDEHNDKRQRQAAGAKKKEDAIPAEIDDWLDKVKHTLGMSASFDVQIREMTFSGQRTGLLFLSSFAKDTALTEVLKRLTYLSPTVSAMTP